MPNWCENDVTIECEDLDSILDFLHDEENLFSFDKLIPYPQEYIEKDKAAEAAFKEGNYLPDGYNQGGYNWCIENWGTKWDACETKMDRVDKDLIVFHFDTAWAPPEPVIEALAKKFPTAIVSHEFFEGGMGFSGSARYEFGELVERNLGDYCGARGG